MNHYNIIIFEIIIYPLIPYLHNNLSDQNLKKNRFIFLLILFKSVFQLT